MVTCDAASLFSDLIIHQINISHFGKDDIDSKYQIYILLVFLNRQLISY